MGIAARVVHTNTPDSERAFGYADTFVFQVAFAPTHGRFSGVFAAAEDVFHAGGFVGKQVGVLSAGVEEE